MNLNRLSSWALGPSLALVLSACASGGGPTPAGAPTQAQATPPTPPGIHWVRTAAEHRIIYETVYSAAEAHVRSTLSGDDVDGAWAVILDADETVLDNSLYQLRRAHQGLGYTSESWAEWVREEDATALPGAVGFIRLVKRLGGHIAIVTNRNEDLCDATRRNLVAVGVDADVVLCRQPGISEKETRFRAVQEGTTPAGLPPLHVVAWVGDNIEDFPGGSQALRSVPESRLTDFGRRFFVLPNPMYGSWTSNPGG